MGNLIFESVQDSKTFVRNDVKLKIGSENNGDEMIDIGLRMKFCKFKHRHLTFIKTQFCMFEGIGVDVEEV